MKKSFLTLAVITLMAGTISTSYAQEPDKKSEKARENVSEKQKDVVEAKQELKKAQKDSVSDYQNFKKESEMKIKENDKSIADLKAKLSKVNAKNKVAYQKDVNGFEQKNANLKKKLDNYKEGGPSNWAIFKKEFSHDMNELGKSLKDFTVKNT